MVSPRDEAPPYRLEPAHLGLHRKGSKSVIPMAVPLACHNGAILGGFSGTRRTVDMPSELLFHVSVLRRPGSRAAF